MPSNIERVGPGDSGPYPILRQEDGRERILQRIMDAIRDSVSADNLRDVADTALRVLEQPKNSRQEVYARICNCGQNGYPMSSPHANHSHRKGCPQHVE
jgi:hypothetical protein